MKFLLVMGLLAGAYGIPKPQEDFNSDFISEVFGKPDGERSGDGDYSGQASTGVGSGGVDVVVQIVKEFSPEAAPSDYVEPTSNQEVEKATIEVDGAFENCNEYTAQFGYECVPYYQCSNGTIITDGAGLIDIRNGFGALDAEHSKCPGFLDVCCKDPDHVAPKPKEPLYKPKCGRRNANGLQTRIQGFTHGESQFGEWPSMVAVLRSDNVAGEQVNLFQCGGSLIAPGVVLTAAHCVDKYRGTPNVLKVRAGEWDTQQEAEPYPHQDRNIVAVSVHPEFFAGGLWNDFAVLFTDIDFDLAPHVDTACLPNPGDSFDFTSCFATGWGKDKFGRDGEYQVVLKEINLPVVPHDQCQASLRGTRLGTKFRLHPSFICAGGEPGKDTCKGDGGSPLLCPAKYDPNTYVQAGIVAWGIGCGENGVPGVYADVSSASCWIDYVMSGYYGQQNGDFSSYWGYDYDTCGAWMENTRAKLNEKYTSLEGRPGARNERERAKLNKALEAYNQYNVEWEGGELDLSTFERTGTVKPKIAPEQATSDSSKVRFGR